jgi:hypothetical protein
MHQTDIQFGMDLAKHPFSHGTFFSVHWVNAQRQASESVALIEERHWELERFGDPLNAFRGGALSYQTVLDPRIVSLVQVSR